MRAYAGIYPRTRTHTFKLYLSACLPVRIYWHAQASKCIHACMQQEYNTCTLRCEPTLERRNVSRKSTSMPFCSFATPLHYPPANMHNLIPFHTHATSSQHSEPNSTRPCPTSITSWSAPKAPRFPKLTSRKYLTSRTSCHLAKSRISYFPSCGRCGIKSKLVTLSAGLTAICSRACSSMRTMRTALPRSDSVLAMSCITNCCSADYHICMHMWQPIVPLSLMVPW